MPRVDALTMDPRIHVALANGKPLMKAIPKRYLAAQVQANGTQTALAKALSRGGLTIHRQDVNAWINGTKHMSNKAVIYVSHVLGVSPLCVLDLCGPDESEAPNAAPERDAMTKNLQALYEWQTTGEKPRLSAMSKLGRSSNIQDHEKLADMLAGIVGDYRDLRTLTVDVAAYYAATCAPQKLGRLIDRIAEAGRAYQP